MDQTEVEVKVYCTDCRVKKLMEEDEVRNKDLEYYKSVCKCCMSGDRWQPIQIDSK